MSRIIICGATGFIGRNIAERFGKLFPDNVVGIWHKTPPPEIKGITWLQADLRDSAQVETLFNEGDVVIHTAATIFGAKESLARPYMNVTDNAVMGSIILRACYEKKVAQFIFPSCSIVYPQNHGKALKESDRSEILPNSPYFGNGNTKVYNEKMCEFYAGLGRTRHLVFRHSNCYGPYDKYDFDRSHMYGATISKVMQAKDDGTISVWGPGTEGRDLLYIDDLVDFVVMSLQQKNSFELVNLGCGYAHPVIDVVKTIIECSGKKLNIEHDLSKPHIPSQIWLDCTKAKELYGWTPKISLKEGTKKTIEWYKHFYSEKD